MLIDVKVLKSSKHQHYCTLIMNIHNQDSLVETVSMNESEKRQKVIEQDNINENDYIRKGPACLKSLVDYNLSDSEECDSDVEIQADSPNHSKFDIFDKGACSVSTETEECRSCVESPRMNSTVKWEEQNNIDRENITISENNSYLGAANSENQTYSIANDEGMQANVSNCSIASDQHPDINFLEDKKTSVRKEGQIVNKDEASFPIENNVTVSDAEIQVDVSDSFKPDIGEKKCAVTTGATTEELRVLSDMTSETSGLSNIEVNISRSHLTNDIIPNVHAPATVKVNEYDKTQEQPGSDFTKENENLFSSKNFSSNENKHDFSLHETFGSNSVPQVVIDCAEPNLEDDLSDNLPESSKCSDIHENKPRSVVEVNDDETEVNNEISKNIVNADKIFDMSELEYIAQIVEDSLTQNTDGSVSENISDTDSEDSESDSEMTESDTSTSTDGSESSSVTSSDSEPDLKISVVEEEELQASKVPPKTKDEVLPSELPPEPALDIHLPEFAVLTPVGEVISFVEAMIVIKAFQNVPALNEETVLFRKEGKQPIGKIFEVFGPVQSPYYTCRFTKISDDETAPEVGSVIYYAPDQRDVTNYVFVEQLKKMKGSDASWQHDQEPPEELIEYSDDEEEAKAKAEKKKKRKAERQKGQDENDVNEIDAETLLQGAKPRGRGAKHKKGFQNRREISLEIEQSFDSSTSNDESQSHSNQQRFGRGRSRGQGRGRESGRGSNRAGFSDVNYNDTHHPFQHRQRPQAFKEDHRFKPMHHEQRFRVPHQAQYDLRPTPRFHSPDQQQRFPAFPENQHIGVPYQNNFSQNREWQGPPRGPQQPIAANKQFYPMPPPANVGRPLNNPNRQPYPQPQNTPSGAQPPFFPPPPFPPPPLPPHPSTFMSSPNTSRPGALSAPRPSGHWNGPFSSPPPPLQPPPHAASSNQHRFPPTIPY